MFFGEYEYKVDEKGRVPVPAKFRRELEEGFWLTQLADKCITAYTDTEWQKVGQMLASALPEHSKDRKLNRLIFGSAFFVNLDGQGRVMLPVPLRQYAGIQGTVIIIGTNNYFEFWDKEAWLEERARLREEAWHLLESQERRA